MIQSHISHAELLVHQKGDYNAKDVYLVNRDLDYEREKHMGKDQKTVTTDETEVDDDEEYILEISKMLKKHEPMWLGGI